MKYLPSTDSFSNMVPSEQTNEDEGTLNGENVGRVLAKFAHNIVGNLLKTAGFFFILLLIGYLQGSLHLFSVMIGCVIGVIYQSYAVFTSLSFFRINHKLLYDVLEFYRTTIYQGLTDLYCKKQK